MDLTDVDKRRNPSGNKNTRIKNLWEVHHEISRLLLLGYKNTRIAEAIGISKERVSQVRNDPLMQRKLALMRGARDNEAIEVADRMKAIDPIAVEVFKKVMETALEDDAFIADKDLRRDAIASGKIVVDHTHPKEVKSEHLVGFVTLEQIQEAKKRALQGGAYAGKIEEGEFEEIKREEDDGDSEEGNNGNGADSAGNPVDKPDKSKPDMEGR